MSDDKAWKDLTAAERREKRFEQWLSPRGVDFIDKDAEKAYRKRVSRFIKAISLEEPDRVPIILPAGTFPLHYAGMTLKEAMYDNEKLCRAFRVFLEEFEADTFASPLMVPPGRPAEIINSLISKWPGHGLPDNASMQQFVEGEYMKEDEYDIFMDDLSDFCLRYYIPRTLGALAPFANFNPLPHILGMPHRFLMPAVMPDVQAAFQAIVDYGKESAKWMGPIMEFNREALSMGYPSLMGGQSHAPFDILADTLRGTRGIVRDMYRQPEKLHQAMEKIVQMNVDCGVSMANASGRPIVFFALHKGDDTFMSDSQYETFYWPTFKKVILGLVEEGCVPLLFAEGKYTKRLKIINDLPRGTVLWWFDQTDMSKAKEILGDTSCISGNVPTSLMCTGNPRDVKEYCRNLIRVCGKGGGFILTGGASIDRGDPGNLRAMTEAVMEYGVYGK
jgi:uroporphyrinogen-III decarboxylase